MTAVATTARDRARLIREGLAAVWDLLTAAYDAEDWKTLGYPSWEAYCTTEFRGQIPRLGKGERGGVVQGLAAHGMPIKAIAAATGIARNTIRRDLRPEPEGGQIDPAEPEDMPRMSRDEWAAIIRADLDHMFRRTTDLLDSIRRELPALREARDVHGMTDVADIIALVEHEDGTPVTYDEHMAAQINEAANWEGEVNTPRYVAYLRDNRPTA